MKMTRHAVERMRERGIPERLLQLTLCAGSRQEGRPDRLILTRNALRALCDEGRFALEEYQLAEGLLPVVCVVVGDWVVTVWRPRDPTGGLPSALSTGSDERSFNSGRKNSGEAA